MSASPEQDNAILGLCPKCNRWFACDEWFDHDSYLAGVDAAIHALEQQRRVALASGPPAVQAVQPLA